MANQQLPCLLSTVSFTAGRISTGARLRRLEWCRASASHAGCTDKRPQTPPRAAAGAARFASATAAGTWRMSTGSCDQSLSARGPPSRRHRMNCSGVNQIQGNNIVEISARLVNCSEMRLGARRHRDWGSCCHSRANGRHPSALCISAHKLSVKTQARVKDTGEKKTGRENVTIVAQTN